MTKYSFNKEREFIPLKIAILCISDTRNIKSDKSGSFLKDRIISSGHNCSDHLVVKDNVNQIKNHLIKLVNRSDVDVVISTGGTGLTGKDVTVEAHRQIYEKEVDAFASVFSAVSFKKIGASAIQSRACAGISNGKFLFALPGSPSACKDAWDEILVTQLDYRNRPCNLVEILPRLDEHKKRK